MENSVKIKGDMTSGNITKHIFTFALPIVMGNIFQQLYNTADAIIVGRALGKNAFAAVNVADPIMSVALFFMAGLCIGVSTLISQNFGAKRYDLLKKYLSAALIAGVLFSLVISALGIIFSKRLLILVNTPEEIMAETQQYLCVIFAGLVFTFLYNFFSSMLRAIGISTATFVFLLAAFSANIILNLAFVLFTPFGVYGVATATIISQALASLLCVIYIYKKAPVLSLKKGRFIFSKSILRDILSFGWAAALQQTALYFGRMLVQSEVNSYGAEMIIGYNAALRIEAFVMALIDATAAALSAYAGQNIGAKRFDRLKKGLQKTVLMNISVCVVFILLFLSMSNQLISMYVKNPSSETVGVGVAYIRSISLGYLLCCFTSALQGFFRGIGKLRLTMFATTLQIVIRVALTFVLMPRLGVCGISVSVISGWIIMLFYCGIHYMKFLKSYKDTL